MVSKKMEERKINRIIILAFLLLPFDSLPYLFKISVYRPYFSIILFLLYFILYIINKKKLEKEILISFVIISFFNVYSYYRGVFYYDDFSGFKKFFVSTYLGWITFSSSFIFFKKKILRLKTKKFLKYFSDLNKKIIIIPLIIGFIQALGVVKLIPLSYIKKLNLLFTYRSVGNRVQMVSGEPSMAMKILILCTCAMMLDKKNKKNNNILWILIIINFLFSLSTASYLLLIIILIIYFLELKWKKVFFKLVLLIPSILVCSSIYTNLLSEDNYTLKKINLVKKLIYNFSDLNFVNSALMKDGSAFMRIINPLIGIIIGFKNAIFGTGGGYYYKEYSIIIYEKFPYALKFPTVLKSINGINMITSKNFYTTIIAENGFIVFLGILFLLMKMRKKIKIISKNQKNPYIILLFISMCIVNFQMDSWMYINVIVVFSFLFVLVKYGGEN